jgi:hypothetical protein
MLKKDIPMGALLYVAPSKHYIGYIDRIFFDSPNARTYGCYAYEVDCAPFFEALGIKVIYERHSSCRIIGCRLDQKPLSCNNDPRYGKWVVDEPVQTFYDSLVNRNFTYLLKDDINIDRVINKLKNGITGEPEGEAVLIKRF